MLNRDAFKLGFIAQCEKLGVAPIDVLEKSAGLMEFLNSIAGKASTPEVRGDPAKQKIITPGDPGHGFHSWEPAHKNLAAVALPVGLFGVGAGAGILGSKLKGNNLDEEDIQKQEVLEELKRQTMLAKQNQRMGIK